MSYALRRIMPLADNFQAILDALPSDWTDLEFDLRVQEGLTLRDALAR